MRTFLMSIFWLSTIGNVVQFLVMVAGSWILFSGAYSFSELSLSVFITEYLPWLNWVKTLMVAMLGELGEFILSIPVLIISPVKFVAGLLIGWWAYAAAQRIPVKSTNS